MSYTKANGLNCVLVAWGYGEKASDIDTAPKLIKAICGEF